MSYKRTIITIASLATLATESIAQQTDIPRIEMMPNTPSPYEMRDWKRVAAGYDSLVFDLQRTGQYLPLIWEYSNTVNYPEHASFGLQTVVGATSQNSTEAINAIPAVIGATLVGIDKQDQNSRNWVLMCEEYFNRRPAENVYLNQPVAQSGSDWWYDTMPNVFFYQLYDLYRSTGHFALQFTSVADQWLQALVAMGGRTTPWRTPSMNYRAWSLSTMRGLLTGVREPEAAGALAWLLYNAFVETGEQRYRIGAEWAMEYLNATATNPSYELQLPYGVYAAARMNAELGTNYNIEKMVNWCFDVGPLRSWGAIIGTWGGYDAHGLIGEISDNDYAFLMNGFEQVGALVPMARYDDRFSRAIGKWVLNLANASRLFYPKYLPPQNQDSEDWSSTYDPRSYIGHEALREQQNGQSPFATGDAITGGWGFTNLALYGSSHVGILGASIDTTATPMILRLDMLKTDYFHGPAYPTYLYFNPYSEDKGVLVEVGAGSHDVYDVVSNSFVANGVSGTTMITVPADHAMQLAIAPAGGTISLDLDKMKIDNVVVDYRAGQGVTNYPPRIKGLAMQSSTVFLNDSTKLYASAEDRDGDALVYSWNAMAGSVAGNGATVTWIAPGTAGSFDIHLGVEDGHGGHDSSTIAIQVVDNHSPRIVSLTANPGALDPSGLAALSCEAEDTDGDMLNFNWQADAGTISGDGATVSWRAPDSLGYFLLICRITDSHGALALDSVGITVGRLVGWYPFDGGALDASGFDNDGEVTGATAVADRFGNAASAYSFGGVNDFIRVPVHPTLNFREAITVSFWMKVPELLTREAFPVSHGSWQNRWKVSMIPGGLLRWTVKTETGVFDLDSITEILPDSLYHVAATYGGGIMALYVDGARNSSKGATGLLLTTNLDLTIGQMVPGDTQYNFKGILDEVRIYNTVLCDAEILNLYDRTTSVHRESDVLNSSETVLHQSFPNPFNGSTTLSFGLAKNGMVLLTIHNLLGQKIATLLEGPLEAGEHRIIWTGEGLAAGVYLITLNAGGRIVRSKMLYLP